MIQDREIFDIKSIAVTYKSCKFTDAGSCILEARFGKLTLKVTDASNVSIMMKLKRLSGNGKISINGVVYTVLSKNVTLDLSLHQNVLEIQRPTDALGEVSILSLCIHHKDERVKKKWKDIVAKCGNYKSIRMINDRLYASDGAFFENGLAIQQITTIPPDISYLDDGVLRFRGSSEITDIVVVGDPKENFNEFVHLNSPGPNIFSSNPTIPNPFESRLIMRESMHSPSLIDVPFTSSPEMSFTNTLYDSDSVREFSVMKHAPDKNGLIRYRKSNGKDYLCLRRGGVFTVPISNLRSNSEYLIRVNIQNLNGNGKIRIGTISNNNFLGEVCLAENTLQEKSIVIKTTSNTFQKLQLRMMDDGVGEVLISRIVVLSKNSNEIASSLPFLDKANKRFVIVIPSYKNVKWCDKNIQSVINQNYQNYRVIYTDDNSPDGTFEKVSAIVGASNKASRFKLIKNTVRVGALHNLYDMIMSCEDEEIILTLDGDDWLSNENVLGRLNNYYSEEDIWMTYGQYQNYPDKGIGITRQIPDNIIQSSSYRKYSWCSSHLRTFYAWLFKKIKLEDLKYQGNFMAMAWDMTMMFPMLEMSGSHSKFISEILYIYNLENPINDHKVDVLLQQKLDHYVRNMSNYNVLLARPVVKKNIGLLLISTGRYDKFVPDLISSADNYFLTDPNCKVTYFLFTDKEQQLKSNREIVQIFIEHKKFPYASMERFKNFTNHSHMLDDQDYLFYVDVDCLFVDHVSREILGNLVGVRHCGFFNRPGPYENNPKSVFYVPESYPKKYKYYFGGGFSGGKKENYLALSKTCADNIDTDVANGIIPLWHDETAINKYFLDHEPDIILDPSYHYPQANEIYYKEGWAPLTFSPKILLLDKNHNSIRK